MSLHIDDNSIGDAGFFAISICVSKLDTLWIGYRNDLSLTMEGIRALANAVAEPISQVILLYKSLSNWNGYWLMVYLKIFNENHV